MHAEGCSAKVCTNNPGVLYSNGQRASISNWRNFFFFFFLSRGAADHPCERALFHAPSVAACLWNSFVLEEEEHDERRRRGKKKLQKRTMRNVRHPAHAIFCFCFLVHNAHGRRRCFSFPNHTGVVAASTCRNRAAPYNTCTAGLGRTTSRSSRRVPLQPRHDALHGRRNTDCRKREKEPGQQTIPN